MDCPQCHRECGQNDKFCSECGYRLCCARTPVTELSVPGNLIVDLTVSISGAEPCRSSAVVHRVVLSDLQPVTECTATVSTAMEEEVLSNATPKTFNRNSDQQARPEHPVSESQAHSYDHTHSQSLGHPDTGPPEDEAEEETADNTSSLAPEPAPQNPSSCLAQSQPSSADPDKSDTESGLADTVSMDGTLREDTKVTVCTAQEEEPEKEKEKGKDEQDEQEEEEETTDNRSSLDPEPAPENPSSCLAQSQPSSADPAKSDAKSGLADTDTMDGTLSKDTKGTVRSAQEEEEEDSGYQEETADNTSSLAPEPAPQNPSSCLAQSQPSSADPAKSDAEWFSRY
ncbi:hypothetical protein ANANG_G00147150 [Anguilla anguilla]|uniref:Uncharacterized protein n=1 Tax=Anguilla anguilla TaxID=7936 RepID=A0A9D3MHP6_ANGAN|nr:hypothetical protein ANANG_G00147150 [Anguilla anguilla]